MSEKKKKDVLEEAADEILAEKAADSLDDIGDAPEDLDELFQKQQGFRHET